MEVFKEGKRGVFHTLKGENRNEPASMRLRTRRKKTLSAIAGGKKLEVNVPQKRKDLGLGRRDRLHPGKKRKKEGRTGRLFGERKGYMAKHSYGGQGALNCGAVRDEHSKRKKVGGRLARKKERTTGKRLAGGKKKS